MPLRRSTRGQKKKEAEAASNRPDVQPDGQGILSTSKKLDEVDGPVPSNEKLTQLTNKKYSKKTAVPKKPKVLNSGKKTNEQKDNDPDDIVGVVEKNSVTGVVKKGRSKNKNVSVPKNTKQKLTVNPKTEQVRVGKIETCENGDVPESCNLKSVAKETDRKPGTAHPRGKELPGTTSRAKKKSASKNSYFASQTADKDVISKSVVGTVDTVSGSSIITEDPSSSDSDFEEVSSQFRTPQSSFMLSTCSDSAISRRLEDSFSDYTWTSSQDFSQSVASSSMTDFSSPSLSGEKMDSEVNAVKTDSENKRSNITGKSAKSTNATDIVDKTVSKKGKGVVQGKVKLESHCGKAKPPSSRKKQGRNKAEKKDSTGETDENNIMAILMKMEGQDPPISDQRGAANKPSPSGQSRGKKIMPRKKGMSKKPADTESSEESDWEEVEDYKHSPVKSQIPDAPVEVTIDDPRMLYKKKKKKEFDWKAYVQRKIKRRAKEIQVNMHKVHLLCLLSHGAQQNRVCSDVTLCATALSVVPLSQLSKDVAFYDDQTLGFFLKWFRSTFCLSPTTAETTRSLVTANQLMQVMADNSASESRQLVMVLGSMLRAMGFNVRLVISLQPVPWKTFSAAPGRAATKRKMDDNEETTTTASKKPKKASETQKSGKVADSKHKSAKDKKNPEKGKNTQQMNSDPKLPSSTSKKNQTPKPASQTVRKRKPTARSKKRVEEDCSSSDDDEGDERPTVPKRRASERASKLVKPSTSKEDDVSDDMCLSDSDGSNFSEEEEIARKKMKANGKKGKTESGERAKDTVEMDEESDAEFDKSFQTKSLRVRNGKSKKKANRKVLSAESSSEEVMETSESKGRDYWLEVYLPRQSKWFCVDCIRCVVGKPYSISEAASKPLLYVLGFENDGSVKDMTARYAPQWLSHTRKQRVAADWWTESLGPYASTNTALDDQENRDIKDHLVQRPLPTKIGDFKNHPLYALRRHLLKYEAIYPENSIPVGYIRHEPVYARECVHTLHSRDNWLREARVVRLGETAYKLVKSRKRWNRVRNNPEELDLELFGRWQTEDYIPPPAVNGKVPKNEYGNVELFQPSMLPGGTVHVRVPALNRVAKKLGIDVAAAMTGWDHHCGYSHPVLDGWVVCEEHKDILLAAWEEDQEIQRQREEERREKRVLNNWTTLVRGLLIKDKLKKKFNLEEKRVEPQAKKKVKAKKGEKATDVQHAWPARQQQQLKQARDTPTPAPSHYTVETM